LEKKETERIEIFIRKLHDHTIPSALITNPSNVFYFTGIAIDPHERFLGLLINAKEERSLFIVPELEEEKAKESHLDLLVYKDNENALEMLSKAITSTSLGIEKEHISLKRAEALAYFTKLQNKDFSGYDEVSDFIMEMRLIKDPGEIQMIKQAALCIDNALEKCMTYIKPGRTEKQLKSRLLAEIAQQEGTEGAAFDFQVSAGPDASNPHGITGDRAFEKHDVILIDCGVNYQNYRSDITRMFFIGSPTKKVAELYNIVLAAQDAAINTAGIGVKAGKVDIAARMVIEKAGYGKNFSCRVGHGLGIDIHEAPSIHDKNDSQLKAGMVFTVEPGIYIPGVVGIRIEDDLLITEHGAEVLTHFPKALNEIIL
jgi:Xaa-Pro dipeptidase